MKGLIPVTTTLCLIRHGETDWNAQKRCQGREDIELNENGKRQAAEIAGRLTGLKWDVIICSPLKRAAATAQIIGQMLKTGPVIINEKFIEREYGSASGLTFEQWKQAFPDGKIPGRENDEDLRNRVVEGLREVAVAYEGKNILLVCHGAVINSLLKAISDGTIDIGETNIKNAYINLVKFNAGVFTVDLYNSPELP